MVPLIEGIRAAVKRGPAAAIEVAPLLSFAEPPPSAETPMPEGHMPQPVLHVEVHEGDGPYLLLVHGLYSGRSHWLRNLDGLREFSTPVVVELLGHGRSPTPGTVESYRPDWYVAEFERIRQWIGASHWYVCGQSLGGALTIRYALQYPEHVIAQAFTNSATAFSDAAWSESRREQARAELAQTDRDDRAAIAESPLNPANNRRLPGEVRAALRADAALHSPRGLALTRLETVANGSVRELVGENRVPALLVVGRFERGFEPGRRYCEAHMPLVETVELDAGHGVNLDRPREFNRALRDFFARGRDEGASNEC